MSRTRLRKARHRCRFLQGATAGGAALLAGCAGLDSQEQNDGGDNGAENGDDSGDGSDDDGGGTTGGDGNSEPAEPGADERQVGVVAALGFQEQQALQQLQQDEIDEAEFDAQLTELLEPILASLILIVASRYRIDRTTACNRPGR